MVTLPGTVGNTSVNARSVTGVAVLLVIVNLSVLVLPGPMVSGKNCLLKVGWAKTFAANSNEKNTVITCFKV